MRASRGFTLVELLVVVGVLVFVIAMLVPALTKAQRQARTVTCLSNLHQLYMGYAAYLPQNHQQSMRYDPTYSAFWPDVLRATFPDVKDILICPEASAPSYNWGTAKSAWGPYDPAHGSPASIAFIGKTSSSYGFNGFLYATDSDSDNANHWSRAPRLSEHVPVFAESTCVDGWPMTSETVPTEIPLGVRNEEGGMKRFEIARHGQSTNASFLDGHAEQIPLEQVRQQKWSNTTLHDSPDFPPR